MTKTNMISKSYILYLAKFSFDPILSKQRSSMSDAKAVTDAASVLSCRREQWFIFSSIIILYYVHCEM